MLKLKIPNSKLMDFFLKLFALWLSAVHLASNCFAGVFEPGVPMVNIYGAPIGYGGGGIDEQHLKLESRTREWCFTLQNRYSQTLNVGVRVHLVDGDTRSFEDAQLLVNANSLLSSGRRLRAPIDHLEVLYLEDAVGNRLFDVNPPPITPEKGATLSGSSSVVSYPPIAPPVGGAPTQYQLSFGNSRGTSDIFNGDVSTATQVQVDNLPTDGRTLYARLNYYIAGKGWSRTENSSPRSRLLFGVYPSEEMLWTNQINSKVVA